MAAPVGASPLLLGFVATPLAPPVPVRHWSAPFLSQAWG